MAKVLLVDANQEHVRLSDAALPRPEFQVDSVGSGREALMRTSDGEYDIIVIGHPLPDIDGVELTVRLRRRGCHVKVVVVSDRGDPGLSLKAMRAGACDFIVKTYRYYEQLADRLRENLEYCDPCKI